MTVQELIDELNKIDDKSIDCFGTEDTIDSVAVEFDDWKKKLFCFIT